VKLSVLIPAYNEAGAIQDTIERIQATLRRAGVEHEIIVIDDGSTDRTGDKARSVGVEVLEHPENGGYGRALKTGLRHATGDWIAITDADGSYPVESLPALLEQVPRFDMAVGARTGATYRESLAKWWARLALKAMVRFVTGVDVPDVNSGLRVFRKAIALDHIASFGNGFSFTTTLTLAMLLESRFVAYVPIEYHRRVGQSKVRLSRDTLRTMQILVMAIVAYNPIKLFLLLAYIALIGGAVSLAVDIVAARLVHAGLIAAVTGSTALLLFGMGLVTDILRRLPRSWPPSR
jgi:glycosyltransferase involved in cell wall biosynthesis